MSVKVGVRRCVPGAAIPGACWLRCGSAAALLVGAPAVLPRGCSRGSGARGGCWSRLTFRANETRCLDVEKDELYCEECEKPAEPGSLPSRAGRQMGQGKHCTGIAKHTIITERLETVLM